MYIATAVEFPAENTTLLLDTLATLVPAGLALLIPFLVESVTKSSASVQLRTFLNAFLAAGAAALGTVVFSGSFADLGDYLFNFLIAWIVTGRTYLTQLPALVTSNSTRANKHE